MCPRTFLVCLMDHRSLHSWFALWATVHSRLVNVKPKICLQTLGFLAFCVLTTSGRRVDISHQTHLILVKSWRERREVIPHLYLGANPGEVKKKMKKRKEKEGRDQTKTEQCNLVATDAPEGRAPLVSTLLVHHFQLSKPLDPPLLFIF